MSKKQVTKKLAKNIVVTSLLIWAWAFAVTADYSSLTKATWNTLTAENWNTLVNNVKWITTDWLNDVTIANDLTVNGTVYWDTIDATKFIWDWSELTGLDSLVWATWATWSV